MSLVPCICIDDKNRPQQISADKWVKEGEQYHILGLFIHLKQNRIQGVTILEKPLDESCAPYHTFKGSRFAVEAKDIAKLLQLAKDCNDLRDMNEADLASLELKISEEVELIEQ